MAKCGSRSDTACGFKDITEDTSNVTEKKKTNTADNKLVVVNKQLTKITNKLETKKKDIVREFVWKEIEPHIVSPKFGLFGVLKFTMLTLALQFLL